MSSSQTFSKAALLSPARRPESEPCEPCDTETALVYWHRTCLASETLHPRQIQFRPHERSETTDFFYSVDEVVAAVESNCVNPEQGLIPTMFASTNDFNNFLNEIDALYRRSVGHWGDYLSSIQTQALRNNQTPLVNADSTITESTLPGQMEENFSDQDRQPAQ